MSQLQAQQPTTLFGDFRREILGEIGRTLQVPVAVMMGDSSRHNYASGRLDHQAYFKSIRVEQSHLEAVVMDHILAAWFDEAALVAGFLPEGLGPIASWQRAWMWDGTAHVDPLKEANAQAVRLASLTTTLADEYARMGLDWETQLRQRAKELQLLTELGLAPSTPAVSNEEPDDQDPAQTPAAAA